MKPLFRTKSFAKLFSEVADYTENKSLTIDGLVVSNYCSRTRCLRAIKKSLSVVPTRKLLVKLSKVMLRIDGDVIDFAVTYHKDGTASVMASYNKILGTRLLAVVSGGSIRKTRKNKGLW